jgi:small multidrug resistance pump
MNYAFLLAAILFEVIATSALKAAEGFTRPWPSVVVVIGYGLAFYFLSLTLRTIPVGIAYAVWSGIGIVLIALAGWVLYRQSLDWPAILGIGLILAGVMVINLFSETTGHKGNARRRAGAFEQGRWIRSSRRRPRRRRRNRKNRRGFRSADPGPDRVHP